jgi:hypothetical protein
VPSTFSMLFSREGLGCFSAVHTRHGAPACSLVIPGRSGFNTHSITFLGSRRLGEASLSKLTPSCPKYRMWTITQGLVSTTLSQTSPTSQSSDIILLLGRVEYDSIGLPIGFRLRDKYGRSRPLLRFKPWSLPSRSRAVQVCKNVAVAATDAKHSSVADLQQISSSSSGPIPLQSQERPLSSTVCDLSSLMVPAYLSKIAVSA